VFIGPSMEMGYPSALCSWVRGSGIVAWVPACRRIPKAMATAMAIQGDGDAAVNQRSLCLPEAQVAESALATEEHGGFWDLLAQLDVALVLSRERENFIQFVGGAGGRPWQSALPLPHATGLFYDVAADGLIVGTTGTPNQLLFFKAWTPDRVDEAILPERFLGPIAGRDHLYLPIHCRFLPGALYIHDVVRLASDIYFAATNHNFIARLEPQGGWRRVWWPRTLDAVPAEAFRINRMQLNAIAAGTAPETSWFTAFSDEMTGPKPWRQGYGPDRRGVVLSGDSRDSVVRGLTCPHSVRLYGGCLWLCNSGYGELVVTGPVESPTIADWDVVARLPGFVRGMCFAGDYVFVGLSKVAAGFESYAPGLDAAHCRCGISAVHTLSGRVVAELWWPEGHDIYDIQVVPRVSRPLLPEREDENGEKIFLRYLG